MKQHITVEHRLKQKNWAMRWLNKNRNNDDFKKKHYEATRKWIEKNRELNRLIAKRWRQNNPDKIAHIKSTRYAREKGSVGSHTLQEWTELKRTFQFRCANCNEVKNLTKDHIIPLSKGGTNYISNIQPLCRECNCAKKDKYETNS